mmetsp:Transcript_10523/g.20211  ORF Transcript_10523/g.20211 Transcript_10523/m.20211 type:complete len:89 (+) Transcript_10523:1159-1425(+)
MRLLFRGTDVDCYTDYLFVQGAMQSFDCDSIFFHVLFDLDKRCERTDEDSVLYDKKDFDIEAIDAAHNAARSTAPKSVWEPFHTPTTT